MAGVGCRPCYNTEEARTPIMVLARHRFGKMSGRSLRYFMQPIKLSLFACSTALCLGYNFLFYAVLGYRTSWISYFFAFIFCAWYFVWRFLSSRRSAALVRLALVAGFLILSLINFVHFKILKTFVAVGTGLITGLNRSEIALLSDYRTTLPAGLVVATLALFVFFAAVEFGPGRWGKEKISKRWMLVGPLGLLAIMLAAFLIHRYPKKSWVSTTQYHADVGPVSYLAIGGVQKLLHLDAGRSAGLARMENLGASFSSRVQAARTAIAELTQLQAARVLGVAASLPVFNRPPNIIFYQLESVSTWAINQNPTPMPFLKKLMAENVTVDHFYGNDCHTVGSEFTSLCGLLPDSAEIISNKLSPPPYACLPKILSQNFAYQTAAYHSNVASFWNRGTLFPLWGVTDLYFYPNFRIRQDDASVLSAMLKNTAAAKSPVFDYFISFTSHSPHTDEYRAMNRSENNIVIEPYLHPLDRAALAIDLPQNELRNYLGFLTASDDALKHFFDDLAARDELQNTIVVIFGDHRYYGFKSDANEFFGAYNELPFVLYVPGIKSLHLPIVASHIDIAPTILDVLGYRNTSSTPFLGRSIFSRNHENLAIGKCADEVYYFDFEVAAQGNLALNAWSMRTQTQPLSPERERQYLEKVPVAVAVSDVLLAYPADYRFEDGTLLQGKDGSVYVLKDGKKLWISDEQVFSALGYAWTDVHKVSDAVLDRYPDGAAIMNVGSQYYGDTGSILRPSRIVPGNLPVAHALGEINGVTGCNCKEAFEENYRKGFRLFEADLSLTQDGHIVAFHDGNEGNIGLQKTIFQTSFADYRTRTFAGTYTLLDADGLLQLFAQHPDAYLILDTKEKFEVLLPEIVRIAKTRYPETLSRIIPQMYSQKQLLFSNNVYPFSDLILTLYMQDIPDGQLVSFVAGAKNITAVTMWWDTRYSDALGEQLKNLDVATFVHTVNDQTEVNDFISKGVGVYTDVFPTSTPLSLLK